MGQIRFFAPNHDKLPRETVKCAYLAGMEGIPWESTNYWVDEDDSSRVEFVLERNTDESGNLNVPWYVEGFGELMLATASLREGESAYNLPLELARGILNRVRNQVAEWRMAGLVVSSELADQINVASRAFIDAVIAAPDETKVAEAAERAIRLGLEAATTLCAEYTEQALDARHQHHERLPTLLGVAFGSRSPNETERQPCLTAFNAASIPFMWRTIERATGKQEWDVFDEQLAWCQGNSLRVIGGPLLLLDEAHLPDWIYLWEDDFDQVQAYVNQHIRETVRRYRGRVQVWNCAARMNVAGAIKLSEEQRLRLIVGAVDELRRNDPQTPVIMSFDQPWAEYLASNERELSPLHLADSLVRADLGIAGVGIELNVGYQRGTYRRELLEFSNQLDRWSMLGLPLVVFLSAPSAAGEDPQSRHAVRPIRCDFTPQAQADFIARLISLMLAKQYVQGVIWNELSDAESHEFAHGGVVDAQGVAKPVLQSLASLRKTHLT